MSPPVVHWRSTARDPILNRVKTRCGIQGFAAFAGDIESHGKVYRTSGTLPFVTCPACRRRGTITEPMLVGLRAVARGKGISSRGVVRALLDRGLIHGNRITDAGRQALADAVKPFRAKSARKRSLRGVSHVSIDKDFDK